VDALRSEGKEPADAVAEARAGQILAEMLGMVCHPEYYEEIALEQTVNDAFILLTHRLGYRRSL
jgi:hypothetical protein